MGAIPVKDMIYAGVIVALLIAFGWYTSHERGIGETKIKEQDAALSAAALQHDKDVETLAAANTARNGDTYVETTRKPIPDSPHVVCNRPTSRSDVPKTPGNPSVSDAAAHGAETDSRDIGPPLDTAGRNADALITALQNQVRILVDAMNGKTIP